MEQNVWDFLGLLALFLEEWLLLFKEFLTSWYLFALLTTPGPLLIS